MTDRLTALRDRLPAAGLDLVAIPPGDDFLYLIGYSPHPDERPCYLFIGRDGGVLLVPELNAAEAAPRVPFEALPYADATGPAEALREARRRLGTLRTIAVGDTMRADALLLLQATWPEARFVPASTVLAPLRMVKSPEEIAALRRAAAAADAAVEAVFAAARPGLREVDLARVAGEALRAHGATEVPFAIVAGGPHSAFPHHHSTIRPLGRGEPLLVDLGGRVEGYMGDITRMAFLGAPTPRYRVIHTIVEEAVQAGLAAVRPGVPAREVDRAARGVITRAGYGAHFTHRTGHGIGLSGHEPPSITETADLPLQVGMAFSVEPGVYLVGEFGVRLEEIVVVTEQGGERLSALPREVRVLEG
ncbi:MAG: Xaa-Pro peptidase family protein [Armatimonadota bacterium]|nr:Xaa-Pro peptidase family protein [Armatimonadota bacterium]MDR7448202.1 Xaa-Pro peptidase family protein [Armatimonadota bacterium]MDR7458867.1 Xaa-Pro peptidase family protein [Armatimonadota bacterium]MDR7479153.1 Xaa-Pro peptidase family protein [Armatimonadota bacterium]MDR7487635.1 Xaa-Pro peptidase family protein [Armatimonadota bacterium]